MICPMLSALSPSDDKGNPVDRLCIYEHCRFFNLEQRDCNLMMASQAMLRLAEQGASSTTSGLSPTALADMERRFTDVGKGLLHSSMEVQDVVRQTGQETARSLTAIGDSLTQRIQSLEDKARAEARTDEPGLATSLQEFEARQTERLKELEARLTAKHQEFEAQLASRQQGLEGRIATTLKETQERIERILQESEGRTAAGLQAYLGDMRSAIDEGLRRLQTRQEEQGKGIAATAAGTSQVLDQLTGVIDLQQKIGERLLEEITALRAGSQKLEKVLGSIAAKLSQSPEDTQILQQLLLVKGQSEKTHAALRGLHEGNRAVIQAIEAQLQRDQADVGRKRQEEAEACNSRGVGLYYRGALEAALSAFRRAVELMPGYAEAHNNLGLVLSKMGQGKEASEAFQEALRLDPAMSEVYNNLGFLYHTSGKFENAIRMFDQAIQNSTDSAVAYANLGNSLYELKQPEKAIEAWRRALELDPMNESARRSLRMFQQDSGNN